MLKERRIVLGVTGGIAAYKAAELVRELVRREAQVRVIMTDHAREFIAPLTFETLSGNPVAGGLFRLNGRFEIDHIALAQFAELVVIAPATANVIGKMTAGIADDLLTTVLVAATAPTLICPAMNDKMYANPVVKENLARLVARGHTVLEPGYGELACRTEGQGRLPDALEIAEEIEAILTEKDLCDERILVTAGPTQEPFDPVRFISNYSSGKMGYALAQMARRRGAEVILISGPVPLPLPRRDIKFVSVRSAEEMEKAVFANLKGSSVVIMAAAVSDYRPKVISKRKIKKGDSDTSLALERTDDILRKLGKRKGNRILVGFAAETEDLIANAQKKLKGKNLDLIVANDVTKPGAGFASDTNQVKILYPSGKVKDHPLMSKAEVSRFILDDVLSLLRRKKRSKTN